jgi:predicted transcriptional regulator
MVKGVMRISLKDLAVSILLLISSFILVNKLLNPTPIQIIVSSEGQPIVVREFVTYTLIDVIVVVTSTIIVCMTSFYILFSTRLEGKALNPSNSIESDIKFALRLLEGDQKKIFLLIVESGGSILQSEIVEKSGFSNAKVTRILSELESKGLIIKRRYGMTNKIEINREMRTAK